MSTTISECAVATLTDGSPLVPYEGIQITNEQRAGFDRDGYLIIRDAIPPELLGLLIEAQAKKSSSPATKTISSPSFESCMDL